ncbi:hypothetical protein [Lysinibacillus sp. YS11]|nr:hypothetical protein [Lysinibacillus sp. YS11]
MNTNKKDANANTSMSIANGNRSTSDVSVMKRMTIVNGNIRRILALAKKRRKITTTRRIIPKITSVKAVFVIY